MTPPRPLAPYPSVLLWWLPSSDALWIFILVLLSIPFPFLVNLGVFFWAAPYSLFNSLNLQPYYILL